MAIDFKPEIDFEPETTLDDFDEETQAKIGNSILYAQMGGGDPNDVFDFADEINEQVYGTPSNVAAQNKNKKTYEDTKSWLKTIKDGYDNAGVGMVKGVAGITLAMAELNKKLWNKAGMKRPEILENIATNSEEWSNMMRAGVDQYYKENPDKMIELDPELGFLDTLKSYVTRPKVLIQSLIESAPIMLEAGLGTIAGGPAGGIAVMSTMRSGEVYSDARGEGTDVVPAFGQAVLTGTIESAIEQWTFGKKLGLGKNIQKIISQGLPKMLWEGNKAFFRGTAEEGSQQFNENFWRWVFTDRSQSLTEGVGQAMGAGGITELAMAGGFGVAGMTTGNAKPVEQQIQVINKLKTQVNDNPALTPEQKKEITVELDKVQEDVAAGKYAPEETIDKGETPAPDISGSVDFANRENLPEAPTTGEQKEGDQTPTEPVAQGEGQVAQDVGQESKAVETTPVQETPVETPVKENLTTEKPVSEVKNEESVNILHEEKQLRPEQMGGTADEIIEPHLYIGNVTPGMKKRIAEGSGFNAEEIKGFTEGGFPTKRTKIKMTRAEASNYLDWANSQIDNMVKEVEKTGAIKLSNYQLSMTQALIGDIKTLQDSLGYTVKPAGITFKRAIKNKSMISGERTISEERFNELNEKTKRGEEFTEDEQADLTIALLEEQIFNKAIKELNTKQTIEQAVHPKTPSEKSEYDVLKAVMKAKQVAASLAIKQSMENRRNVLKIIKEFIPKDKQRIFMRKVALANTEKDAQKITDSIIDYLNTLEHREAVRNFGKTVKDIQSDYRKGNVSLGALPKTTADKITNILDVYDVSELSEDKANELESRKEWLKRTADALADGLEDINQEMDDDVRDAFVIGKRRREEIKRLSKIPVTALETDDIVNITNALKQIVYWSDKKKDSKHNLRMSKLNDNINKSTQEILPEKKDITELSGVWGGIKSAFGEKSATIKTLVNWITGKTNDSTKTVLYDDRANAERENAKVVRMFRESFAKFAKKRRVELETVKKLDQRVDIKIGGKKVNLSYNDLLGLYGLVRGDGNLEQLLKTQGLEIVTRVKEARGLYEKKHTYLTGTPTVAEIRDIVNQIPDKMKKLMDVYFELNREVIKPVLNKTSMEYGNFEIAYLDNYWHIARVKDFSPEGTKSDTSTSIDRLSMFQVRTGGTGAIRVEPFTVTIERNIEESALYASSLITEENARIMISNKQWRMKLKKAGLSKELNTITELFRRQQGLSTPHSIYDQLASDLLPKASQSLLSVRITGGIVQASSAPAAYRIIPKDFFSPLDTPKPADIQTLKDKYDFLWLRYEGKNYNYATGLVASKNSFKKMLFDYTPATEKGLDPYTWGDEVCIYKIYKAAQRMIEATTKLKEGSRNYDEAVGNLVYESLAGQGQYSMLHRSEFTSSQHWYERGFAVFMSTRTGQLNSLYQTIDDYQKGRISAPIAIEQAGGIFQSNLQVELSRRVLQSIIGIAGATGLAALGLTDLPDWEDLEKELKRTAEKTIIGTFENMFGLSVPGNVLSSFASTVIGIIKYRDVRNLSYLRSGNLMTDIALDLTQASANNGIFIWELLTEPTATFKSGKNKGRLKWVVAGEMAIMDDARLIAYRLGLPFEGIIADFVWPIERLTTE